jgi:hypothetical protein
MERYPELAALNWEWHTENYSMGKGNYLDSTYTDYNSEIKRTHYGQGGEVQSVRYMLRFGSKYDEGKEFPAFRGHPGENKTAPAPSPQV